jgi:hypothetical protein
LARAKGTVERFGEGRETRNIGEQCGTVGVLGQALTPRQRRATILGQIHTQVIHGKVKVDAEARS